MGEYSKYIDEKRREVDTPKDIVDENGKCVVGTFNKEFEQMNFLKAKKPTKASNCFNRLRLTLWEATEVHFKEGLLLSVVCDMGVFGKTLNIFYDYRNNKVHYWDTNLKSKDTIIAPNLINGSIAEAKTDVSHIKYENHFEEGKCHLQGNHQGNDGKIEYDLHLERISKPSIVSIPFNDKNMALYTQKDFFKASGTIKLDDEVFTSDEESTAIIDDHRGYYPHKMHYDWITTFGKSEIDGEKKFIAFNLTRNQSIDQDKYNENLIWLEGKTSVLPPVTFEKEEKIKDFKDEQIWHIKDEYDMVNLTFTIKAIAPMLVHALVVMIDYYVFFGHIDGYIRDEDGKKYTFDKTIAMGEDKTMKF